MQKYFNKLSPNNKGFTIIELIVVVAIIAVLASIVLANVSGYINQGKDAAIKANLSSLMSSATQIMEKNGSYNGGTSVCMTPWTAINSAINSSGGSMGVCANNANNWCAQANLASNNSTQFCVDSTGKKNAGGGCSGTTYTCT